MSSEKTKSIIGKLINYLIGGILIISGALKLIKLHAYSEMIERLSPHYFDNIYLIGAIALISGMLFIIPKTFTYGFIATITFLGGTISAHMQIGDNYIPQLVFVLLTTLSAYLLKPEWFK